MRFSFRVKLRVRAKGKYELGLKMRLHKARLGTRKYESGLLLRVRAREKNELTGVEGH